MLPSLRVRLSTAAAAGLPAQHARGALARMGCRAVVPSRAVACRGACHAWAYPEHRRRL